jgi:hypothetical protein
MAIILLASVGLALPTLVWVFPDQEELHTALFSTFYYAQAMLSGEYPMWNNLLGFGTPQPFASNFILHPAFLLFSPDRLGLALFTFFAFQVFFGSGFTYLLCRRLGANEAPSLLAAITFILCSPTIVPLFVKVMPTYALAWTLLPAILYAIIALAEDDRPALGLWFKTVALGLLIGVLVADGHAGTYANFGLSIMVFSAVAAVKRPRIILPLMGAAALGLLIAADKAYLLINEIQLSLEFAPDQGRSQFNKPLGFFSFWAAFLKPLVPDLRPEAFLYRNVRFGGATDPIWTDLIFFGPPFALTAVYTAVSRRLAFPWRRALTIAASFSLVMLLLPAAIHEPMFVSSGNIIFIAPVVLFSIPLAAVGLSKITERIGVRSALFLRGFAVLQIGCLVLGALPYVILGVAGNNHLGHGEVLAQTRPLANYLKSIASGPNARLYLSPRVEMDGPAFLANWGGEGGNAFAIWGMPQVQGYFKAAAMENFAPDNRLGESQIHGTADALVNKAMLDVLGIEFILAFEDEIRDPGLLVDAAFETEFGLRGRRGQRLVLLRNPQVWPQAVGFAQGSLDRFALPVRPTCSHGGLLCRDYSQVRDSRLMAADIRIAFSDAGDAVIHLDARHPALSLLVTQAYRPGWRATADNGAELPVWRALEGYLTIDVAADVSRIDLSYAPPTRVKLAIMQAFLLAASLGFLGVMVVLRRRSIVAPESSIEPAAGPEAINFTALWRQPQWRQRIKRLGLVALLAYGLAFVSYRALSWLSVGEISAEIVFYAGFLLPVAVAVRKLWGILAETI